MVSNQKSFLDEYNAGRRDFSGESLQGLRLPGFRAEDSLDLSGADLTNATLSDASFSYCNLSSCRLVNASLGGVQFIEANLEEADLSRTQPDFARFNRANLTAANLSDSFMEDADFSDSNLSRCSFRDATLVRPRFSRAVFAETLFDPVLLAGEFVDTDLSGALMIHYAKHESPSHFDMRTLQATGLGVKKSGLDIGKFSSFLSQAGVQREELTQFQRAAGEFVFRRAVRSAYSAQDPLGEFGVSWQSGAIGEGARALARCLSEGPEEKDMQSLIGAQPVLLAHLLSGGHGRYVIPQKRLGCEHVTDFMVAERDSLGFHWLAVELESPRHPLFTKAGNPRAELTHAIRQIHDWRNWLAHNRSYASRPQEASGLGLTDVESELPGLIVIGRRSTLKSSDRDRRRRMAREANILIHTYDWLLECALTQQGGQLRSDGEGPSR